MYGVTTGIEAAAETAAKLEASLNVKKKLDLSEVPKAFFKNTDVQKIIQAEYSINHCNQAVRNLLCKGATQEKIREYCEAYVSTKGRYIREGSQNPPPEKSDKAYGLYLFIQGPNKRSVDLAIAMIEGIIATGETRPPALMSLNTAAPPPAATAATAGAQPNMQTMPPPHIQNLVQMQVPPPSINLVDKVPIGIDRPLPGFNLPMKLIGQNGSNLQYIRNETGAVVTLRGIGSAFIEPSTGQEAQEVLHFSIEHSKPDGLATARELVLNLIATVQQEYSQFHASHATAVQPVAVDPNMIVHQPPLDQQLVHQPVLATSITLPVVQAAGGFIQQPSVAAVPPPQFNHPPPTQLSLPPPGLHIPPQQGPLVPPPGHPPQQLQIQQPGDQTAGMVQQPLQPATQQQQQQYLITQSGQPVQGIMTSQGFVVLNQQPQQVFLSQPPGHAPQVIHQGQLAFQTSAPTAVSAPVSYQLQYVQSNQPPVMTGSPIHVQQQQQQQQQHAVVLQPPSQVQFQNGAVQLTQQQMMGVKPGEQGQMVQVKQVPQMHVVQSYMPTVQYVSSPGLRPEQAVPVTQKEPRLGKRKFTEEADTHTSPSQQSSPQHHSSPQQHQQQQQQQSQPMIMQMHPQQIIHPQQMIQAQFQGQIGNPQPVPHPTQALPPGQHVRQGVGLQDMMGVHQVQQTQQQEHEDDPDSAAPQQQGEGGETKSPPPPPGAGNGQYLGQQQPSLDQQKISQQNQWFEDANQKARNSQQPQPTSDYGYGNTYSRRDRPPRERPTFNHYSSKPQMYGYQQYIQPAMCPPPPPPPPPLQQPQQQQHYFYHRR